MPSIVAKKGGSDDDCLQIARWPDALDIDLLDISGGSHQQPRSWGYACDVNEADSRARLVCRNT